MHVITRPASNCYLGMNQVRSDFRRLSPPGTGVGGLETLSSIKKIWPMSDGRKLSDNQRIQKGIRIT